MSHSDDLFIITDSFNLELSIPTNQVLTRYSDNCQEVNSVLDTWQLYYSSRLETYLRLHSFNDCYFYYQRAYSNKEMNDCQEKQERIYLCQRIDQSNQKH